MEGENNILRLRNNWKNRDSSPDEVAAINEKSLKNLAEQDLKTMEKASEIASDLLEETESYADHPDVQEYVADIKAVNGLALSYELVNATLDDRRENPLKWRALALVYKEMYAPLLDDKHKEASAD